MVCGCCGRNLEGGAFPGARLVCACGEVTVVPPLRPGAPDAAGPYRAMAAAAPDGGFPCPFCSGRCADGARRCPTCDVDLDRVRCPKCLGIQKIGARVCAACDTELTLDALVDPEGGPCPRCSRALSRTSVAEVDLDECLACGGVFASHDALGALLAGRVGDERIAELRVSGPIPVGDQLYVRCPVCDQVMNRSRFAPKLGLVVDACQAHGLWFDGGEITRALAFAARGGEYVPSRHRGRRPTDPKPQSDSKQPASARGSSSPPTGDANSDLLIALLRALFT